MPIAIRAQTVRFFILTPFSAYLTLMKGSPSNPCFIGEASSRRARACRRNITTPEALEKAGPWTLLNQTCTNPVNAQFVKIVPRIWTRHARSPTPCGSSSSSLLPDSQGRDSSSSFSSREWHGYGLQLKKCLARFFSPQVGETRRFSIEMGALRRRPIIRLRI